MTLNTALFVVALVVFVLVACGVSVDRLDAVRMVAAGLALLTAGHLVWR